MKSGNESIPGRTTRNGWPNNWSNASYATSFRCYRAMHRWKDRRKEVELALFPSYVFVQLSLQHRSRVLDIPSVVHLVSFQGKPAPLPEHEIEKLRQGVNGRVRMGHTHICRPASGCECVVARWPASKAFWCAAKKERAWWCRLRSLCVPSRWKLMKRM